MACPHFSAGYIRQAAHLTTAEHAEHMYSSTRPAPPAASSALGCPMPAGEVSLQPQVSHAGLVTCTEPCLELPMQ